MFLLRFMIALAFGVAFVVIALMVTDGNVRMNVLCVGVAVTTLAALLMPKKWVRPTANFFFGNDKDAETTDD